MGDNSSELCAPVRPKPLDEVLPHDELLDHFKHRIDQLERERVDLLAAVERCGVARDEVHSLEWEARKRAEEVAELQRALSDAQQFLFEERQRLLLLQAENDELKLQELQDRQRIQQLLALSTPLEQSITYHAPGGGPPTSTVAAQQQQQQQPQHRRGAATGAPGAAAPAAGGERVLRTVFLPTVDADFLLLKVESLQAQLAEQKQLHEERLAALLADRQARAQEEERQRANLTGHCEALARQVKQLEAALQATTRDYILARQLRQEAQDTAAAATAQLASEVGTLRAQLATARRQARTDTDRAASAADSRLREYMERFREQVRAREEELTTLSALHASTKAAAEARTASLEARVAKLLEANRQLELRRQLDVDGWAADVTALRKSLAVVDRKLLQMRLVDRLEDDERLDALLDQLEKKVPDRGGAGGGGGAQHLQQQQRQIKAVRGGLQQQQQQHRGGAGGARRPVSGAPAAARRAAAGPGGRRPATAGPSSGAAAGRLRHAAAPSARRDQHHHQQAMHRQQQQQQQDVGGVLAAAASAAASLYHDAREQQEQEGGVAAAAAAADLFGEAAAALAELEGLSSTSGDEDGGGDDSLGDSSSDGGGAASAPRSIKSSLAAELAAVRQQLQALEVRAAEKAARALQGVGGRC